VSFFPSSVARVPTFLSSQIGLSSLTRTSIDLFRVQAQLATGREILRPSDDAIRAATIGVLDERLERSAKQIDNLELARGSLDVLDSALGSASDSLLEARSLASDQSSFGADPAGQRAQATVVQNILAGMLRIAQQTGTSGYVFGGATPGITPVVEFRGGYRYVGQGDGLETDIPTSGAAPITIGGSNPLGETSARVRGTADLDPSLTADDLLADLAGARGLGIAPGLVRLSISGGASVTLDLSGARDVRDVIDLVHAEIVAHEDQTGDSVLGPDGISVSGNAIAFDLEPGQTLVFSEVGQGTTGQDLGLVTDPPTTLDELTDSTGADLAPRLSWLTPVSALAGLGDLTTDPLGRLILRNAGGAADIDLSGAQTLQDVKNAIERTGLGVRVVLNADGTGIDVLSEVSGGKGLALSISESGDGTQTASRLGIRSLDASTSLSDFNEGEGVEIIDGATDPITGLPDPEHDVDFEIELGDAAGTRLPIDLRPQDMVSVGTLLARINDQIATGLASAGLPAGSVSAGLIDGNNGIALTQDASLPNAVRVVPRNNSKAAEQLGLRDGAYDAATSTYLGEDRAKVRPDTVFTRLADLRDALNTSDRDGIAIAGEKLESMIDRVAQTRAFVGGLVQRVQSATTFEEDRQVFDQSTRSQLRDLDYAEAATRLSVLQTQLQAGLQATAITGQLSLLDFIG
jgi:flagellin-like hook-associated protein FlgL